MLDVSLEYKKGKKVRKAPFKGKAFKIII